MSLNSNSRFRPSRRTFLLTATAGALGVGGYTGWELLRDKDVAVPPTRAPLWDFEARQTGGRLNFSLAVDGGGVFAATSSPGILALDATTGRKRWSARLGEGSWESGSVTVADGSAYLVTATGAVQAYRADDGELLWSARELGSGYSGAAAVLGSTLCVQLTRYVDDEGPGKPGALCGLDSATGRVRWTTPASGIFQPLPGRQLLFARTGELTDETHDARPVGAVNPLTGAVAWEAPASADEETIGLSPDGDTVYLLDEEHRLCAYATGTGERRWRVPAMDGVITVTEDGGTVYVCTYRGDLASYDARSGERRWRRTVAKGYSRPAVAHRDGRVFITSGDGYGFDSFFGMGGERGYVLALAADSGKELWRVNRMEPCSSPPTAVGDDVIVTHSADWWAYDARTGKPRWRLAAASSITADPYVASGVLYGLCDDGIRAARL
ncbi:hypothetical protein BLA24_13470 [Streptomyces cinnamoneus]|uniref:Pyrrolo-quinoline quinone repeat domain-containing protein n=1 Tax=Streptomyces cinnamoneus TaxID=53446 RepID=A0A2G1XJU5_STRCJ|nr:PQQ-binding-like beta-propeller repeat protein [Streptomyces cinnamoneus]PHQ51512.1 hypothetical protein BLA24_13470 [Streptomyces cinnamoneus]PPT11694.1 hypothetical protein CYQ11_01190 [Streptomyces cinnamoneus]